MINGSNLRLLNRKFIPTVGQGFPTPLGQTDQRGMVFRANIAHIWRKWHVNIKKKKDWVNPPLHFIAKRKW